MYGPESAYDPMEVRQRKQRAEEQFEKERFLRWLEHDGDFRRRVRSVLGISDWESMK